MTRATSLLVAALVCVAGGALLTQSFRAQPVDAATGTDAATAQAAATGEETEPSFDTPPVLDYAHAVAASYPEAEREQNITGTVLASVDIAADGTVSQVTIKQGIEGHPAFEEEVLRVVKLWHFAPAQKDGHSVASQVVIPVKFELH